MAQLDIASLIQESLMDETTTSSNIVESNVFNKINEMRPSVKRQRAAEAAQAAEAAKPLNRAKAFGNAHGGKIAAGSLAAIGAGVGAKALLNYLRKKKKNG